MFEVSKKISQITLTTVKKETQGKKICSKFAASCSKFEEDIVEFTCLAKELPFVVFATGAMTFNEVLILSNQNPL